MKPSEFYELYWRVDYGNGPVPLPKLSQAEKDFLDSSAESDYTQGCLFTRKRGRNVQVDVQVLKQEMLKFFTPSNPPKLDKYGSIIEPSPELPNKKSPQP